MARQVGGGSIVPMSVQLSRPRSPRISFGSTLARRRGGRSTGIGLVRLAVGSLVVGLLLGLLFAWHQTTSPTTALLLGGSILVWSMMSFGSERPK
jgi:hypothetical protein